MVSNDFYDSNTILVEMLIQLADDTTLVTDGGSYGFNVEVEYASDGSKKTLPTETILATHDKTVVNFVNILFQQILSMSTATSMFTYFISVDLVFFFRLQSTTELQIPFIWRTLEQMIRMST